MAFRRGIWGDWAVALGMWTCLGFGLGWYQSYTNYGVAGWPAPMVEAAGGKFLYLFAAAGVDVWFRKYLWIASFPVAGVMWALLLQLLAPAFKQPLPRFTDTMRDLSWGAAPVVFLSLIVMAAAWLGHWGWWWDVREFLEWPLNAGTAWPWLGNAYLAAGVLGLAIQLAFLWVWSERHVGRYLGHIAMAAALLILATSGVGALTTLLLT